MKGSGRHSRRLFQTLYPETHQDSTLPPQHLLSQPPSNTVLFVLDLSLSLQCRAHASVEQPVCISGGIAKTVLQKLNRVPPAPPHPASLPQPIRWIPTLLPPYLSGPQIQAAGLRQERTLVSSRTGQGATLRCQPTCSSAASSCALIHSASVPGDPVRRQDPQADARLQRRALSGLDPILRLHV